MNVGGPYAERCSPAMNHRGVGAAIVLGARESRVQGEGRQGSDVQWTTNRGSPWASSVTPVKRAAPMRGLLMTDHNREVATPWRAGCGESRTSGSEGGVGKHSAAVRPAPTLQHFDMHPIDADPGRTGGHNVAVQISHHRLLT